MKRKELLEKRAFFETKLLEYWQYLHEDYQLLPYEYDRVRFEAKLLGISIESSLRKIGPKKLKFPRNKLLGISDRKEARKYIASMTMRRIDKNLGVLCGIRQSREYQNAKTLCRKYKDAICKKELAKARKKEKAQ